MARTFAPPERRRAGRARARAGHQRPLRPAPPLPGADRLLHAASSTAAGSTACASPSSATATTWPTPGWTRRRGSASTSCSPARPATSPTPAIARRAPGAQRRRSTPRRRRGRARRRRPLHRRLDQHGPGGRGRRAPARLPRVSRSTSALLRARQARRARHALPAGAPRRGDHRRGDRRPAVDRLRPGREPPARAEGDHGVAVGRGARACA